MKFKVKNWEIFFENDKNNGNFKVKRYDFPFFVTGSIKNGKINTDERLPKYVLEAIKRFYPVRLWKVKFEGMEILLTAPGNEKQYNIVYDSQKNFLYYDYPNEIPRTLKEYLQTYMYFQNKNG